MSRPNRNRKKTSIYLGPDDHQRIEAIRRAFGLRTDVAAIRRALAIATQPIEPDIQAIIEIIQWADRLQFTSPKEQRELREHTKKCYDLVNQAKARSRSHTATRNLEPKAEAQADSCRRDPDTPPETGVPEPITDWRVPGFDHLGP